MRSTEESGYVPGDFPVVWSLTTRNMEYSLVKVPFDAEFFLIYSPLRAIKDTRLLLSAEGLLNWRIRGTLRSANMIDLGLLPRKQRDRDRSPQEVSEEDLTRIRKLGSLLEFEDRVWEADLQVPVNTVYTFLSYVWRPIISSGQETYHLGNPEMQYRILPQKGPGEGLRRSSLVVSRVP